MQLNSIRRALKVKLKDVKLNRRTIEKIESGSLDVSVKSLQTYLETVGLKMTISL